MTDTSLEIIADRPRATARRPALPQWLALAAGMWGLAAALYYFHEGLTLSHYDAKGHLVVARRVIDSLTPGWQQLGAVWLPLPHLLNLFPVQIDVFYRTGWSGVAISIASLMLLVYASARLIVSSTGSAIAATFTAIVLVTNPNLLYLQSTPMTEPLLLGLLALGIALLYDGIAADDDRLRRLAYVAFAFACLTRYEAWLVTGAAVGATFLALWRGSGKPWHALRETAELVLTPLVGIAWFLVHSRVTVGEWFVTGGFYVPDPAYQGKAVEVTGAIWWGIRQLGSETLARAAALSVVVLVVAWIRRRDEFALIVALAWLGTLALAWYAFYHGHPLRIRYMVPAVAASAILLGLALGRITRGRAIVAALLLLGVLHGARPFDAKAAMVLEAQWDRPRGVARRAVTACLPRPGGNETVMASMGSLAHYMQELSASGYELRDFLHEGNGDLWLAALAQPSGLVRWILIEEVAEGGDMLAQRARSDPKFLGGFQRICEGGGVALYKATATLQSP
jgi:hypothetical protein